MCLLDNREVRKGWEPLKTAVGNLFTKHGVKVLSSRRWDERRLAYPINGQHRATYLLTYFAGDPQFIAGVRRDLEFSESVMRYLVTECDEVPQSAYEPEAAFDVNAIPVDDAPDAPEPEVEAGGGVGAEGGDGERSAPETSEEPAEAAAPEEQS